MLTLTLLIHNICAHIVHTHSNFFGIYKRNFLREVRQQALRVWQIAVPAEIQRWLI